MAGISCYFLKNPFIKNGFHMMRRNGHTLRGNSPAAANSLDHKLSKKDDVLPTINIGFPRIKCPRSSHLSQMNSSKLKKDILALEKKARNNILQIDLNRIKEDNQRSSREYHIATIAKHYGVFKDLFGSAYFIPRVPLNVQYNVNGKGSYAVKSGNVIAQSDTTKAPTCEFDASVDLVNLEEMKERSYWSLILTNPDSHLSKGKNESIHWFISNIPNGDMQKGDIIVPYLQPLSPKGLGYQRFIFILYKQRKEIDFKAYETNRVDLERRTFCTLEFYKKFQNDLTPAGLVFFQSTWDENLTEQYHSILGMKEPLYKYDFPNSFLKDQEWFPLKQPFNFYLEKYRNEYQLSKENIKLEIDEAHPFEEVANNLKFPNAHPIHNKTSWQITKIKRSRKIMNA